MIKDVNNRVFPESTTTLKYFNYKSHNLPHKEQAQFPKYEQLY